MIFAETAQCPLFRKERHVMDENCAFSIADYATSRFCAWGTCVGVVFFGNGNFVRIADLKYQKNPPSIVTSIEAYEDMIYYRQHSSTGVRPKRLLQYGPLPVLDGGYICSSHRPDAIAFRFNRRDSSEIWKSRADPHGTMLHFDFKELEAFDVGATWNFGEGMPYPMKLVA
jgi:hypothetical protein